MQIIGISFVTRAERARLRTPTRRASAMDVLNTTSKEEGRLRKLVTLPAYFVGHTFTSGLSEACFVSLKEALN